MISVKSAISIAKKNYPDKKILGQVMDYKGGYCFSMVPKDYVEGQPNWDSSIIRIDKTTGSVSQFSVFDDINFMTEATPINEEL